MRVGGISAERGYAIEASRGKADLFARLARLLSPGGRVVIGDVVVTDAGVSLSAPLALPSGFPDLVDDQLASLRRAGLRAELHWADADLAVSADPAFAALPN
jgi:tRNA (cmo5U34)-methyltransferase